ncbi:hypothetical protein FACS1894199_09910 [Bacteroidia bacterium]|nr:hypothetical protein FACS1894199_09910 [Bacteroidia bacterium]
MGISSLELYYNNVTSQMSNTRIFFIALASTLLLFSCATNTFTATEKSVIHEQSAMTPFRVLKVTNKEDSIVLRTACKDIIDSKNPIDIQKLVADTTLKHLISRLIVTLATEDGVGIAAPQVGISKNLFLFLRLNQPDEPICVAINPKIVNHPDTTVCFERDGCLSIPDAQGNSVRYPWVDVEYYNEKGELIREHLEGYSRQTTFTAIIFQHEYDHLQGILFTDSLCEK